MAADERARRTVEFSCRHRGVVERIRWHDWWGTEAFCEVREQDRTIVWVEHD